MLTPETTGALLATLDGTWTGAGRGEFPTIEPFRYRETLRFTRHADTHDLHYEQRTWLVSDGPDDGQPSHWESGFLLVREDGSVHLLNAQQSGRVEVLVGALRPLDAGAFELDLESVVHAHDPRLCASSRVLRVAGDELSYTCRMTTDEVHTNAVHLECRLERGTA